MTIRFMISSIVLQNSLVKYRSVFHKESLFTMLYKIVDQHRIRTRLQRCPYLLILSSKYIQISSQNHDDHDQTSQGMRAIATENRSPFLARHHMTTDAPNCKGTVRRSDRSLRDVCDRFLLH